MKKTLIILAIAFSFLAVQLAYTQDMPAEQKVEKKEVKTENTKKKGLKHNKMAIKSSKKSVKKGKKAKKPTKKEATTETAPASK